jgi:hypothetical protein
MVYDVIVGNVGTVRSRVTMTDARRAFREYKEQSKTGKGRAGHEPVYIMGEDGPLAEYHCTCKQCRIYQQGD